MNDTKNAQICGEIGEMVGREADCHQSVTDCHGLNTAAMRDALEMVKRLFDGRLMWQPDIRKAHEAVNAALSAPPRNCDVGTAEEQAERFYACITTWAQMPYEEGGAE